MKSFLLPVLIAFSSGAFAQDPNIYEVYAIEYASSPGRTAVKEIALHTDSSDSVAFAYYFWYLKGANGRNVLVDAGFIKDSATGTGMRMASYQRPDRALERLGVRADDITDLIITHPHYDHIGGMGLFRNATVWMQKKDYAYFVGDAWQNRKDTLGFKRDDVRNAVEANLEGRLRLVDGDSVEILPGIRAFTGSLHTAGSQHLLVRTATENVLLASDDAWFYVNIAIPASIPFTLDPDAYLRQLKRMKILVSNADLIIPGHDALVLSKFPLAAKGVVRIR